MTVSVVSTPRSSLYPGPLPPRLQCITYGNFIMPKCANPLFLRWVKQFHDEKDYRKRGGPPRATGYENAIRALETCTETYAHPVDMRGKVSGVGPTTIERCVLHFIHAIQWGAP